MRLFHKILLVGILLLLGLSLISFRSDSDDLYWYVEGEPYFWEEQADVYAFRTHPNMIAKLELNTDVVDRIQYRMADDKIKLVYFKENTTEFEKRNTIANIESSFDFDVSFPVITLFPNLPYSKGMWFVADDRLMANFKLSEMDSASVQDFEIKYNLLAQNRPSENLNSNANFTYIFKIDETDLHYTSSIQLARSIYLEEKSVLENVQPNLINAYEESGSTGGGDEIVNSIKEESLSNRKPEFYLVNISQNILKVFSDFPSEQGNLIFSIYDLTGKKLFVKEIQRGVQDFTINLISYPSGLYIANIENSKGEALTQRKFRKF